MSSRIVPGRIINTHQRLIYPLELTPDVFDIRDAAHTLSVERRYHNRPRRHYSVAEHSVQVSLAAARRARETGADPLLAARIGLAHDLDEVFLRDLAAPYKALPQFAPIVEESNRIRRAWFEWLGLPTEPCPESAIVADIDARIIANEARVLFPERPPEWELPEPVEGVSLGCLEAPGARGLFLAQFVTLWPDRWAEACE
jgi:hypothetical protein